MGEQHLSEHGQRRQAGNRDRRNADFRPAARISGADVSGQPGSEDGQRQAHDYLVHTEPNGHQRVERSESRARRDGGRKARDRAVRVDGDNEPDHRAHEHHAFDTKVDHTGALGDQLAQRRKGEGRAQHDADAQSGHPEAHGCTPDGATAAASGRRARCSRKASTASPASRNTMISAWMMVAIGWATPVVCSA
jgi:hypothetical protein